MYVIMILNIIYVLSIIYACYYDIYAYYYDIKCSPMARETWVQSQVESYQRL